MQVEKDSISKTPKSPRPSPLEVATILTLGTIIALPFIIVLSRLCTSLILIELHSMHLCMYLCLALSQH